MFPSHLSHLPRNQQHHQLTLCQMEAKEHMYQRCSYQMQLLTKIESITKHPTEKLFQLRRLNNSKHNNVKGAL